MRPKKLKTRIFLDSGDPTETRAALDLLGFLDGQTTNPTLIAKNPQAKERLAKGQKFTEPEIFAFYKKVVTEISGLLPKGFVSIEVYADAKSTADGLFAQAKKMNGWIPNAHIKYPITEAGLAAAERSVNEGMRVNMTLCFSQEQGATVYSATKKGKRGDVFISPFVGRLDDVGENGLDLIENMVKMFRKGDKHVEVLSASVRTLEHFVRSIELGADIITAPLSVLKEWKDLGMPLVSKDTKPSKLQTIHYQEFLLTKPWRSYDFHHILTDKGLARFAEDWNNLIK